MGPDIDTFQDLYLTIYRAIPKTEVGGDTQDLKIIVIPLS
jgi:hypothetical protein